MPGVYGVGLGPKNRGGQWLGGDDPAIIVYTTRKHDVPPQERIPAWIEGIPTDVEERELGSMVTCPPDAAPSFDESEYSTLLGGIRIEAKDVLVTTGMTTTNMTSGTGGCLAYLGPGEGAQRTVVMLTCHHCIVGRCQTRTDAGQSVGHPDHYHCSSCSACCTNLIGRAAFMRPELDVAAVAINEGKQWVAEIRGARRNGDGTFSNVAVRGARAITVVPSGGIHVRKRGMRTGLREGNVRSIETSVPLHRGICGPLHPIALHDALVIDSLPLGGSSWFSCPGDSGSAVLNDEDEVVGIVSVGGAPTANAVNIGAIIAWFASQGRPLEIASATALNQVRTAAAPQNIPAPQQRSMVAMGGFGMAPAAFGTRLTEVRDELTATDKGREYATVIERHAHEARTLVNKNKRVATVWHRSGGPQIVQAALAAIQDEHARLPEQIEGKPFRDCIRGIAAIFTRYGSKQFADDIARFEEMVARLGGSTYRDLKAVLA